MSEKGWYSLTVRKETALMVRERAKTDGLTVDEFLNKLLSPVPQGVWSTCPFCGKKIKTENMAKHMAQVHPKSVGVGKA